MTKHRGPHRRYYLWQIKYHAVYLWRNFKAWLKETKLEVLDIINELQK